MKKNVLLLFVFLFLIISKVAAQSDFKEGFIITISKDTLYGTIDDRANAFNYKSCRFSKDGKVTEFTPDELLGYGIAGENFFTSQIMEDAFVEVLVQGELSLFMHEFMFFVQKSGGEVYTLSSNEREIKKEGYSYLKKDVKWKGVLSYLISDCKLDFRLDQIKNLNEKALTQLVLRYNECVGANAVIYKVKKPWIKAELGIIPAVTHTTLRTVVLDDRYAYLADQYSSIDPSVGALFAINFPRIGERIAFQTEVHYFKSSFASSVVIDESFRQHYHDTFFDFTTLSVPVALRYSFTGRNNTFFINAGGYFNHYLQTSTWLESEIVYEHTVLKSEGVALELKDSEFGFWGGLGLFRSFRPLSVGVTARYFHSTTNLHPSHLVSVDINRLSLALMLFRKLN
jgi:hypothetical protein